MEILDRLLDRVSLGKLPAGAKPPQGVLASQLGNALQRITQPSAVIRVLLFRNGELLWKETYDGTLQSSVSDDQLRDTVRAVSDFMTDSFGLASGTTSYVFGPYYVIGISEGPYQLVALAQRGVSEWLIRVWMRQVLKNVRTQFQEG